VPKALMCCRLESRNTGFALDQRSFHRRCLRATNDALRCTIVTCGSAAGGTKCVRDAPERPLSGMKTSRVVQLSG
jgi:hypothetical protein